MSNQVGDGSTTPAPKQAPAVAPDTSHAAFLLLVGQVVGVLILAWIAGTDDRLGGVIVAFFAVLWLIWIMNRSDVVAQWATKVGL